MKIILLIILLSCAVALAQTYTEFYCDATPGNGTNINAGSTTAAAAVYTSVNGNWDGTSIFTPTDGTTPASTVSSGMWLSVYYDNSTNLVQAGTMGGAIALVTNVAAGANGAITVDRRTVCGTAPTSSATGRSIKVGGSWAGMYGSIGFPFGFINNAATNGNNLPRVNMKNAADYVITAALSHSPTGVVFQGYSSIVGDGGKFAIKDSATSASYVLLTFSGSHNSLVDCILSSSFSSGTSSGFAMSGQGSHAKRVVVHDVRLTGITITGSGMAEECEAYNCNKSASTGGAGFACSFPGALLVRCISHDNSATGSLGYNISNTGVTCERCIADTNKKDGFQFTSIGVAYFINCDSRGNLEDGFDFTAASIQQVFVENCNIVANIGWGINSSGTSVQRTGQIVNCGFGSGIQGNSQGDIAAMPAVLQSGNISYASGATPWPGQGNFSITLRAAKSAGRGAFTQTAVNYSGTVGYPDIGAAQSPSTNSASYTFAQ